MKEFVGEQQNEATDLMWELLNQEQYDYQRPERGEIRQGVVLDKNQYEILVDVGVKQEAVVPTTDLEKLEKEELEAIQIGDEIPVYIMSLEDDGRIVGSINMAKSQEDWIEAERLMESGEIIDGEVSGHNKGGVIVPFGRLRGFIPASQVMGSGHRGEGGQRGERLEQMLGRALKLKVIEVNQKRRRLILSERAAMKEWRAESKSRLLDELSAGDVRKGVVTNLMNFGAFVDLGGADGLVHVSEMAWHRVKHPKDLLEIGQEVDVQVLSVDKDEERIALSMKRLLPDPWSQVTSKYSVGDVVEGEVTNLTEFGAFARIEQGVEGLIHISELSDEKVEHPREIVHRGQRLTLRIISIDSDRQRIGLSLKRAPQPLIEDEGDIEGEEMVESGDVVEAVDTADETPAADDVVAETGDDDVVEAAADVAEESTEREEFADVTPDEPATEDDETAAL